MILQVMIENERHQTLDITLTDPSKHGIYIKNIEGLGYPQGSISSVKGIMSNISDYKDTVIQPRNLVFTFGITDDYNVEFVRNKLYDFFPSGYPIKITFQTDVVGFVYTHGYVETLTPNIFEEMETIQISLICPDPYFYTGRKVEFEKLEKIPKFNLTDWFEANVQEVHFDSFNNYYERDTIVKPVSLIDNEDSYSINVRSKYRNPKDFSIAIRNTTLAQEPGTEPLSETTNEEIPSYGYFNKIILIYKNGILKINSVDSDYVDPTDLMIAGKNTFENKEIIIISDMDDQNVYSVDLHTGERKNILDICLIEGDFPSINIGDNFFKIQMYGVYPVKVNEYFINIPDKSIIPYEVLMNSINWYMWTFYVVAPAAKIEIKMYDNIKKTYLGKMIIEDKDCLIWDSINMTSTTQHTKRPYALAGWIDTLLKQYNYNLLSHYPEKGDDTGSRCRYGIRVMKLGSKYYTDSAKANFFNRIPTTNVFEANGDHYAVNVKGYMGSNANFGSNLNTDPLSIPLCVKFEDLQISMDLLFDYLHYNFSSTTAGNDPTYDIGHQMNQILFSIMEYGLIISDEPVTITEYRETNDIFAEASYQEQYLGI